VFHHWDVPPVIQYSISADFGLLTYADWFCSLAGSDYKLFLPEHNVPGVDIPGGHQYPPHPLPLLNTIRIAATISCTKENVFSPIYCRVITIEIA
jgi:hypothetical protein